MKRVCRICIAVLLLLGSGLVLEVGQVGSLYAVDISIPTDDTGEPGDIITVLVNIGDVTGEGVLSVWLAVTYDDSFLTATSASTIGTIAEPWGAPVYNVTPGQITVGMASFEPLVGSGVVLYMNFEVADTAAVGSTSDLAFTLAELNEGAVPVTTADGLFTVIGNQPVLGISRETMDNVTIYRVPTLGSTFLTKLPSFSYYASKLVAQLQESHDLIYSVSSPFSCEVKKPFIVHFQSTRYGEYLACKELKKPSYAFLNKLYIPFDRNLSFR